jgi:hypothetical protein
MTSISKIVLALLLCCLLGQSMADAQQALISLPAEVKGEPGDFLKIPATTIGAEVRWYAVDTGLKIFPADQLRDSKTAVAIAIKPGKYRLIAWTAIQGTPTDAAVCVVIIGDAPGPDPPPPPPPPPPPTPVDPLFQGLASTFASDPASAADKAKYRDVLAGVYNQIGELAFNAEIQTIGQLYNKLRDATKILLPDNALRGVREVVATEFQAKLPTRPDSLMDHGNRELCLKQFKRMAELVRMLRGPEVSERRGALQRK